MWEQVGRQAGEEDRDPAAKPFGGVDTSAIVARQTQSGAGFVVMCLSAAKARTLQDRPGPIKEPAADAFGG